MDQNFPPFVLDAAMLLPGVELAALPRIDPRASDLDDRELILFLRQRGWHGLITNNYKMLRVPREIAAVLKAKIAEFAIQGLGDDPFRATGALMLHMPAIAKKVRPGHAQVFHVHPRAPSPTTAWEWFQDAAQRRGRDSAELYEESKVTDDELATDVLSGD